MSESKVCLPIVASAAQVHFFLCRTNQVVGLKARCILGQSNTCFTGALIGPGCLVDPIQNRFRYGVAIVGVKVANLHTRRLYDKENIEMACIG